MFKILSSSISYDTILSQVDYLVKASSSSLFIDISYQSPCSNQRLIDFSNNLLAINKDKHSPKELCSLIRKRLQKTTEQSSEPEKNRCYTFCSKILLTLIKTYSYDTYQDDVTLLLKDLLNNKISLNIPDSFKVTMVLIARELTVRPSVTDNKTVQNYILEASQKTIDFKEDLFLVLKHQDSRDFFDTLLTLFTCSQEITLSNQCLTLFKQGKNQKSQSQKKKLLSTAKELYLKSLETVNSLTCSNSSSIDWEQATQFRERFA